MLKTLAITLKFEELAPLLGFLRKKKIRFDTVPSREKGKALVMATEVSEDMEKLIRDMVAELQDVTIEEISEEGNQEVAVGITIPAGSDILERLLRSLQEFGVIDLDVQRTTKGETTILIRTVKSREDSMRRLLLTFDGIQIDDLNPSLGSRQDPRLARRITESKSVRRRCFPLKALLPALAIVLAILVGFLLFQAGRTGVQTNTLQDRVNRIGGQLSGLGDYVDGLGKKVDAVQGHFEPEGGVTKMKQDLDDLYDGVEKAAEKLVKIEERVGQLESGNTAFKEKLAKAEAEAAKARASAEAVAIRAENEALFAKLAQLRQAAPESELSKMKDEDVKKALASAERAKAKKAIETAWANRPVPPTPPVVTKVVVPDEVQSIVCDLESRVTATEKVAGEASEAAKAIAQDPTRKHVSAPTKKRLREIFGISEKPKPPEKPRPRLDF